MTAARLRAGVAPAAVTMIAVLVTVAAAVLIDPEPGLAVFGTLLAISLSSSQLERDLRGRLEAGVALPAIALLGAAVGFALSTAPFVGAAAFCLAGAASVYCRRFGERGRRLGGLLVLPFAALLVAPVHSDRLSGWAAAACATVVGLVAWAAVTVFQLTAVRVGVLPRVVTAVVVQPAPPSSSRPDATTRLAVQMLVTLAIAFAVGFLGFGDRWAWVVITALTVTVGNTGRADVADKALQRVVGAGAGSIVALVVVLVPASGPGLEIVAALVVLFAGLVLRHISYVWWAFAVTVVLAVAQGLTTGPFPLGERWEEIVVGGIIAVVVAALVLPVPSEASVRRAIADVLAALSDWLTVAAGEEGSGRDEAALRVRTALRALDRRARPFDGPVRWLPASWRPRAVGWVDRSREATALLLAAPDPRARRALGDARRAIREPGGLQAALDEVVVVAS
ncbi:MAG: FUSC family protein [Microbacterium sp.]|uniref:FUSC family protein n=1 Tax=Microbacterium sp. TaxID=51671 RepID=UPI0039E2EE9D